MRLMAVVWRPRHFQPCCLFPVDMNIFSSTLDIKTFDIQDGGSSFQQITGGKPLSQTTRL